MKEGIAYVCEELGRLKSVLVHTPGEEQTIVNELNYKLWLYDKIPDVSGYIQEHRCYQELLESKESKESKCMNLRIIWKKI